MKTVITDLLVDHQARGVTLSGLPVLHPEVIEVRGPTELAILDGVIKQSSNTAHMYHYVADVISFCSHSFTLLPGDLILTGVPGE